MPKRKPHGIVSLACLLLVAATSADEIEGSALRTGEFEVTRSGAEVTGLLELGDTDDVFREDETLSWKIYVPPGYDPAKPAGLIVFISPTRFGWVQGNWLPVLDEGNYIWISPARSGNNSRTKRRILMAIISPYVVSDRYAVDPERIYVAGFSGGGKVASHAAVHFANLFKGGIYICGTEPWSGKEPEELARAAGGRYVFMTGTRDFNRIPTKQTYEKYIRSGLVNSKLIVESGLAHAMPAVEQFREAVYYLDQRE